MDGWQVRSVIRQKPWLDQHFMGIFAKDTRPKRLPKRRPLFYITNTDVSTGPGKHWVTFYYPTRGDPEFFDSLGKSPSHYGFKGNYKYKNRVIQAPGSKACGKYAIAYALYRTKGLSQDQIYNQFLRKNLWLNDDIAAKTLRNYK
jgi:hypothetical protein